MARSHEQQQEVDRAMRTARAQLQFIGQNVVHLSRLRNGARKATRAAALREKMDDGTITPEELSEVDGLYEATMKALGLPSVPTRHDHVKRW